MRHFSKRLKSILLSMTAFMLVAASPMTAAAEQAALSTATPAKTTQLQSPVTPVPTPTSVPTKPAPSPAPKQPEATYSYNHATDHWDTNKWYYDPTTHSYKAIVAPKPVVQSAPVVPMTIIDPTAAAKAPIAQSTPTIPSTSTPLTGSTSSTTALTNALDSTALTGNASVTKNTVAGNATSGNASATTTIMNNINSTVSNANNQKAASFVSNVIGDVNGDIVLQPMLLKAMLEAGSSSGGASSVVNTNQLTNNVNLNAASGNATVSSNTQAGNAVTGSANTVANVMNIVNSMVTANKSFVGTINIYGNLNGDILIAPDFIPQLLASNAASPTITVPNSALPTSVTNITQSIVNNVALAANSGKAAVAGNTSAGNATSGNGTTNVVLFNLSGHQVVAKNSLLVFVNVLGKWVGVIVDAPAGATAAAIGNGITNNTTVAPDLILTAANTTQITNNIQLNSRSGDALVAHNTSAGNALSGNATASANIGNIVGSQLGLSDWFGVLFINVFGTWYGSFGVDTAAGNRVAVTPSSEINGKVPLRVFEYIPRTLTTGLTHATPSLTVIDSNNNLDNGAGYAPLSQGQGPVVASADVQAASGQVNPTSIPQLTYGSQDLLARLPLISGATFLSLISLLGLKRTLFGKHSDSSGIA